MKFILQFFLLNLILIGLLEVCSQETVPKFKCPRITNQNENNSEIDPNKVCVCLNRQLKIVCRLANYDRSTFDVVKIYFQNLRDLLPHDQRHLNQFAFILCLNLNYDNPNDKNVTTVPIGFDTMSGISFDHIAITYCDQQNTNPIRLELNPHFLTMQAQSLQKLEIEITSGNNNNTSLLLSNLAHAIMRQRKLSQLIIWLGENLRLKVPSDFFAEYSSVNYLVPLKEITFVDDHFQEMTNPDEEFLNQTNHHQVITIESYAFANLRQIQFISFRDVFIESIANFAFALFNKPSNDNDVLTIEFIVRGLHYTKISDNSFSGIGRDTTINFANINRVPASYIFVPNNQTFGSFLSNNPQNKLKFGYMIDCKIKGIVSKIRWMLEAKQQHLIGENQIVLYCNNKQNIFDYKFD